MRCRIRRRALELEDLDGAIITCSSKELIGRIESDSLDMALVQRDSFQLLKRVSGPNDDLGIQANRDQNGRVVRPRQILHIIIMSNQSLHDLPILHWRRLVIAKASTMSRWIWIVVVYAYDLVVRSTSQPLSIRTESDGVDCAAVIAQVAELLRLVVFEITGVADSVHAPDADLAITGGGCETGSVGRDMARVYFKVFLFT